MVHVRAGARQQVRGAFEPRPVGEAQVEPVAADLRLERVGGAGGHDDAVVEHDDLVGQPVGLVEEDHPRAGDQAHRQVQPPAHPAGVLLRPLVGRVGEAEALQQLGRAPPCPRPAG